MSNNLHLRAPRGDHTAKDRLADRSAIALAACWIVLVAVAIWMHTSKSTQPPIYDAYTYYFKAREVWQHGSLLHPFQLLSIQPTFRPPGTVLMSYPFGFSDDFRPFYFRSVFLPILLLFVSGAIVIAQARPSGIALRFGVLATVFFPTISLFYYFEPYDGGPPAHSHWGLVDCYLSGVISLAAACGIRGLSQRSIKWSAAATLLCSFAIFVKPSGAPLAALVGALTSLGWIWMILKHPRAARRREWQRFAGHVGLQIVLLGGSVLVATHSQYLGPANMAYGQDAIVVMRAELGVPFDVLMNLVRTSLGPFILTWCALVVCIVGYTIVRRRLDTLPQDAFLLLAALATLLIGIWFWLYGSAAPTQLRYFLPFLCVTLIFAVGPLSRLLVEVPRAIRWCLALVMLASILNISLLLALPNPSLEWQLLTGVNVAAGTRPPSIEQAKALIAATPPTTGSVAVYSLTGGLADAMFESIFDLHRLASTKPDFRVRRPIDWQRPSAYRIEEIASSDYLLFDTQAPDVDGKTASADVDDYYKERIAFVRWAEHLTSQDGIEVFAKVPHSTLLKVTDIQALRASLEALVKAHQWRDVFIAANRPVWWSEDDVKAALKGRPLSDSVIHFEGLYEIIGARIEPASGAAVRLRFWVRRTAPGTETGWAAMVHLDGPDGKLLVQHDSALPSYPSPTDRPYLAMEATFVPPAGASDVAIGIYRGDGHLLKSDPAPSFQGKDGTVMSLHGATH